MVTHITESQCSLQSGFGVCYPAVFEEETTYLSKNYYFQFLIMCFGFFFSAMKNPAITYERSLKLFKYIYPQKKERMLLLGNSFCLSLSTGDVGILPPTHPIRQELLLFIKLIQWGENIIHLYMVIASRQYLQILLLLWLFNNESNTNGIKLPVKLYLGFNYGTTPTAFLKDEV